MTTTTKQARDALAPMAAALEGVAADDQTRAALYQVRREAFTAGWKAAHLTYRPEIRPSAERLAAACDVHLGPDPGAIGEDRPEISQGDVLVDDGTLEGTLYSDWLKIQDTLEDPQKETTVCDAFEADRTVPYTTTICKTCGWNQAAHELPPSPRRTP